ncbi:MAG TPA: P-II family nitrogen regulator [Geothermobacteraceae bacterium]|nr:P-II family nitrogen regulator [Geothermobacteraceae bacterium]
MKEIKAYIKKHKLDDVIRSLRKIEGLTGVSLIDNCGYGIGWGGAKREGQIDCRPGVKVEIVCLEALVDEVVASIEKAAHTGLKGDGKIYVGNIEQAVRISTGERGEGAV